MIIPMPRPVGGSEEEPPDIIRAAYAGDHRLVSDLLQKGADVNAIDPNDNLTVLHIACLQGDRALAEVVLERDKNFGDVDFNIRSRHRSFLAWQFAMCADFVELAELVDNAGLAKAHAKVSAPHP